MKTSKRVLIIVAALFALGAALYLFLVSSKPAKKPLTKEEALQKLVRLQAIEKELESKDSKWSDSNWSFKGSSKEQFLEWQKKVKTKLLASLGKSINLPEKLNIKRGTKEDLFVKDRDEKNHFYTRQQIHFNGARGDLVKAYLLKPKSNEKSDYVICVPGHSRLGVDEIVGIKKNGKTRTAYGGAYQDYALQCVAKGFVVLAIEQSGMGSRRHALLKLTGINGNTPCELTAYLDRFGGKTLLNYRIADIKMAIRLIDALEKRKIETLAIMGASAGGTTALFAAALNPRIKCCVVVSYLNHFKDSILARSHCACNYVDDLTKNSEMSDVACLIAPRCLYTEYGCFDDYFPPESAQKAYLEVKNAYRLLGVDEKLRRNLAMRGHLGFSGDGVFQFMSHCLSSEFPEPSLEQ